MLPPFSSCSTIRRNNFVLTSAAQQGFPCVSYSTDPVVLASDVKLGTAHLRRALPWLSLPTLWKAYNCTNNVAVLAAGNHGTRHAIYAGASNRTSWVRHHGLEEHQSNSRRQHVATPQGLPCTSAWLSASESHDVCWHVSTTATVSACESYCMSLGRQRWCLAAAVLLNCCVCVDMCQRLATEHALVLFRASSRDCNSIEQVGVGLCAFRHLPNEPGGV